MVSRELFRLVFQTLISVATLIENLDRMASVGWVSVVSAPTLTGVRG